MAKSSALITCGWSCNVDDCDELWKAKLQAFNITVHKKCQKCFSFVPLQCFLLKSSIFIMREILQTVLWWKLEALSKFLICCEFRRVYGDGQTYQFLFNLGWIGIEQELGLHVVSLCSSINVCSNSVVPSSLEYSPWTNMPILSLKLYSMMGFTLLCQEKKGRYFCVSKHN